MAGQENRYLTRARLLKGVDLVEEVETDIGIFRVRPLRKGEQAELEAMSVKGIKASGKGKQVKEPDIVMDMDKLISNDWEVKFSILAHGMSIDRDNKFTVADIKKMTFSDDVMNTVISKIKVISGMEGKGNLLDKFRAERDRKRDSSADSNGADETDGEDGRPDPVAV